MTLFSFPRNSVSTRRITKQHPSNYLLFPQHAYGSPVPPLQVYQNARSPAKPADDIPDHQLSSALPQSGTVTKTTASEPPARYLVTRCFQFS